MTNFNLRAWTFGVLVGALALSDWFAPPAPADIVVEELAAFEKDGVTFKGAIRDVAAGDRIEKHAILALEGDGCGSIRIALIETEGNPMSRMPPMPARLWTKSFAFDTTKSREIDLGVLPVSDKGAAMSFVAAGDDALNAFTGGEAYLLTWFDDSTKDGKFRKMIKDATEKAKSEEAPAKAETQSP